MKKLKAAIIGLGVGEQHIKGYNSHPDCEVVAICDFDKDKLGLIGNKYPELKQITEAHDIINDPAIDIISIASYDNFHYNQIIETLLNNKHVFVEKPVCLYQSEAKHIHSILKQKTELKLSSNLILRMSPRFCTLKQQIEDSELGELFYIEGDYNYGRLNKITDGWRGEIDFYSVVYGGGVHIIDLFLWLTGDLVTNVASFGNNISSKHSKYKYNDIVVCILKFKSGMVGKMSVNFGCVYPHFHALSVYGTKATFQNTMKEGLFFSSRDPNVQAKKIYSKYPGIHKGDLIINFIDSILYNSKPVVSSYDVFNTMAVCFAIEKAIHTSSYVAVEYFK